MLATKDHEQLLPIPLCISLHGRGVGANNFNSRSSSKWSYGVRDCEGGVRKGGVAGDRNINALTHLPSPLIRYATKPEFKVAEFLFGVLLPQLGSLSVISIVSATRVL